MRKVIVGIAAVAVAVVSVLGAVAPAYAHQESTVPYSDASPREEIKTRVQGRLDEARRKVCATRTDAIAAIVKKSADAGQRHLTLFNSIHKRVDEFYTSKKLQVTAYESLASAAQSKYDTAAAAIKAVRDLPAFDCGGDNPMGVASQYRAKIKAMHDALKDYRSGVHAVLVAVKNAAGTQQGGQ